MLPTTTTTTTHHTNSMSSISQLFLLPDFNQTLKVGLWDQQQQLNNNNNSNNNNNNNSRSSILSITDPILTKLWMEGFWDKTLTKTTTPSSSSTTPSATKQKQKQQKIHLSYHWPNFDQTWYNNNNNNNYKTKNNNTFNNKKQQQQQISAIFLTWIGPRFKARFLDQPQWKQQLQYIIYYHWPNFDQTFILGFCDQ